jgi:hypothetical protein
MSGQPWGTPNGGDDGLDGGADGAGSLGGITDADRDAAVAALDVHRDAGRLDDVGFEERSVRVRRAYTRADLDLLFIDLPEPHPVAGAPAWGAPTTVAPVPPAPQDQRPSSPQPSADPRRPLVSPEVARKLVALAPFIAFALFWVTKSWVFFLLIPVMGIFFGGRGGGGGRRGKR